MANSSGVEKCSGTKPMRRGAIAEACVEKKRGAIGVGDARRKVRSVRSIGTRDGGVVHEGRMAACNCRFVGVFE